MSTIEDFENAPVGATATRPGVPVAVKVSGRQRIQGNWDDGFVKMSSETLVDYDYALNPAPPTSAQEALDLAWDLAHPVKEGQTIPEGARYVRRYQRGDLATFIASESWTPDPRTNKVRTLDPLPDPEPEVREHPVTIYHGDRKVGVGRFVWHPGGASIVDVEPCKSDTLHDAPRTYSACLNYDGPWGTRLGGDPA